MKFKICILNFIIINDTKNHQNRFYKEQHIDTLFSTMNNFILLITATCTALISGLLYSYSCSVNIGLGRLPDRYYIAAMQAINSAILNPMFFVSFIGTLLLLPLCTYLEYHQSPSFRFWLLLSASVLYLTGVFGTTMIYNVPLNNMLAGFDLNAASETEILNMRIKFENPWLFFHTIRTIGAVLCLLLVLVSLIFKLK